MKTKIKVENRGNESNLNLIRRFSKRVRHSNLLNEKRNKRFHSRQPSEFKKKQEALRRKRRLEEVDQMIRYGKMPDRRRRRPQFTAELESDIDDDSSSE